MHLHSALYHRAAPVIAFGVMLAAGLLIYFPGLNGPFLFDDQHNFIQNKFVHMSHFDVDSILDAFFSAGNHFPVRGLSRLSFALNHYFSDGVLDPWVFKLTNLIIHLLNAVLVFALARALLMRLNGKYALSQQRVMWTAALCASLWLLHPLQLTSILYAVQRMTSLSAMFMFAGLLGYIYGRRAVENGDNRGFLLMAVAVTGGVLLGVLNKENAALLPFLAYVVHLAFFPTAALAPGARRKLQIFHLLFVGSALVIALAGIIWSWSGFQSTYELHREFSMSDRLLTQPRVLLIYLSLLLLPSLGRMSLHHDELLISTGWLSPPSTLIAVVLIVAVLGFALWRLRSGSLWAFSVVFFLLGHSMESSFLPLEMMHEHRNYFPSFALALLCAHAIVYFSRLSSRPVALPVTISFGVLLALSVVTWARAGIWSNEVWLMRYMVEQHPNSYRALSSSARLKAKQGGSVSEVFRAYAKIAHANPTVIFPIMRMRRAVNGLQFQIKEGVIEPERAPATAVIAWDPPELYADLAYLNDVASAIDVEVKRRLPLSPVSDETLGEFRQIRECLNARYDLCIDLDDEYMSWLRVALTESKMEQKVRARILNELAWQHEREGRITQAHAALKDAVAEDSSEIVYQLRRVLLFVRQQEFDEAERLLQRIEKIENRTWLVRRQTFVARQALEAALSHQRSQGPGVEENLAS